MSYKSVAKALILAAGRGKRLMPFTKDRPKCLVEVGGKPILFYQLRALSNYGISDVAITTGYRTQDIIDYVRKHFPSLKITFISNSQYDTTNDIYSFCLAKDFCNDDFLQIDGDVLFHADLLQRLLSGPRRASKTCIKRGPCGEEEMKTQVDTEGFVRKISKTLLPEETTGEFMSISLFSRDFSYKLFSTMEDMIQRGGAHLYSGEAMDCVIREQGGILHAIDLGPHRAIEIDFPEDLREAEKILPKITPALI